LSVMLVVMVMMMVFVLAKRDCRVIVVIVGLEPDGGHEAVPEG